jgi:predicted metal-binding membrane protein
MVFIRHAQASAICLLAPKIKHHQSDIREVHEAMTAVWRLARRADIAWLGFFLFVGIAWTLLFALAVEHPAGPVFGALSPSFDVNFWRALCAATPQDSSFLTLCAMWIVMSAAMMAPTAIPFLSTFRDISRREPTGAAQFVACLAGYLVVWSGFAVIIACAQQTLTNLGALSPHGVSVWPWLTGTLLILAGFYQFSSLKNACLRQCRSPLAFLIGHWREGVKAAWRMGLLHGMFCVGCCWALMVLGFVGGTMNLIWMGGAMVLMFLEKLPGLGAPLTRPIGVGLLLLGCGALLQAGGVRL